MKVFIFIIFFIIFVLFKFSFFSLAHFPFNGTVANLSVFFLYTSDLLNLQCPNIWLSFTNKVFLIKDLEQQHSIQEN